MAPAPRTRFSVLLTLGIFACTPQRDPAPRPEAAPHSDQARRAEDAPQPTSAAIPAPPQVRSPALLGLPAVGDTEPRWGDDADATGFDGVVTSVDRSASAAGVSILEQGGNAVDAAVATALALAVTHPSAGNIGGGGFMLLKKGMQVEGIDFREDSPRALTDKKFWAMIKNGGRGAASVGVPGTVAGLALAHERHGVLPWKTVVEPARKLAADGYPIGDRQVKTIGWARADLEQDPVAKEALLPGGKLPKPGQLIRRPKLAVALSRIADEGPQGFYEGQTADDIVASLGDEGLITKEDLKSYKARIRQPLHFDFGEYRIITMPAPSAGGVALTQGLLMLRESQVTQTKANSTERFHLLAEAGKRAQAERQLFVVAPESLSRTELTDQRKRALDPQTWLKKHPISKTKATESSSLHPGFAKALAELQHTTHLSVIDSKGNLVSLTVTLSGSYGSRVFTKETGIVLNNSTGSFSSVGVNTPHPGRRTTSSMAPTLALWGDRGALVLGSPGGDTIPSTVSQLILHLVVDGLSLKEAVQAKRIHQTFAPGHLLMERSQPLAAKLQKTLSQLGHQLSSRRSTIGDANVAAILGDEAYAVCDRREGGAALAATQKKKTPDGELSGASTK